jgi:hypothetical protein
MYGWQWAVGNSGHIEGDIVSLYDPCRLRNVIGNTYKITVDRQE